MPRLEALLKLADAYVAAMTAEQREAMFARQRRSFVRGMTTPCEHGVLDFEDCRDCRATPAQNGGDRA